MADIFLSYHNADHAWAAKLEVALRAKGWQVFWDRRIPTGKSWESVIQKELLSARCIVVLWSARSIASDWVKIEASHGLQRGALFPVLIDDVNVPIEFSRIQAARLVDWRPESRHWGFDQFLEDLATVSGTPAQSLADSIDRSAGCDAAETPSTILLSETGSESRRRLWDHIATHTVSSAILIQYSNALMTDLVVELIRRGAQSVDIYVQDEVTADGDPHRERMQQAREEIDVRLTHSHKFPEGALITFHAYLPHASLRAALIDDTVLTIGWYTYQISQNSRPPYPVRGDENPGLLLSRRSEGFEVLKAFIERTAHDLDERATISQRRVARAGLIKL